MVGEQHVVLGGNDRGALTEPMLGLARIAHYSVEKIRARQVQLAPQHIRGGVLANDHAARQRESAQHATQHATACIPIQYNR